MARQKIGKEFKLITKEIKQQQRELHHDIEEYVTNNAVLRL
jgi:hypothetical protein